MFWNRFYHVANGHLELQKMTDIKEMGFKTVTSRRKFKSIYLRSIGYYLMIKNQVQQENIWITNQHVFNKVDSSNTRNKVERCKWRSCGGKDIPH